MAANDDVIPEIYDDPAEVERLWAEEIKLRVGEIDRGEAETFDGEEVMAELRARVGK